MTNFHIITYMEVHVSVDLCPVLKPDDLRPRFAPSHANEHYFPAQFVVEIEMRGFCDPGSFGVSVITM